MEVEDDKSGAVNEGRKRKSKDRKLIEGKLEERREIYEGRYIRIKKDSEQMKKLRNEIVIKEQRGAKFIEI